MQKCTFSFFYLLINKGFREIKCQSREGFSSKDDTLPEVFYHPFKGRPLDGKLAIDKADFQKALRLRYELMGWGVDTGIPPEAKLT